MQNYLYNPCTAYCALSASDNSRVGVTTLLYITYWFCITNQYNHYKNNFAHLLIKKWLACSSYGMQTSSVAAKVRHLFGLCKDFEGKNVQGECKKANLLVFLPSRSHFYAKVWKWRWFLTDVGCFEMQNAASANQRESSTNHIEGHRGKGHRDRYIGSLFRVDGPVPMIRLLPTAT